MSAAGESIELAPGDLVAGRYRIESILGSGGMGIVYRATQVALEREVALKVLLPQYAAMSDALARFEREAKVAAALEHPGAVRIYDHGRDGALVYLAMEVLHGQTLRDAVEERGLRPLPEVLTIGAALADVLAAAHEIDLVHRDLKPENIFLEPDERGGTRVVVLDFGLAFIADRAGAGRMTEEGIVSGTPDYMAPEQAGAEAVGPSADVYALGCVLYELLTGRPPFAGPPIQLLAKHLYTPPTPPREVLRDRGITHDLNELVLAMLRKRAEDRPAALVVQGMLATQLGAPIPERARDVIASTGRAGRMISAVLRPTQSAPTSPGSPPANVEADPVPIGVVGALDGDLVLGLAANGLLAYIAQDDRALVDASVIYAPRASTAELERLVALGVPVMTDTDAADMDRMTAALDLGVHEVVPRPVRSDELARRIWRAIRRVRRSSGTHETRATPVPEKP